MGRENVDKVACPNIDQEGIRYLRTFAHPQIVVKYQNTGGVVIASSQDKIIQYPYAGDKDIDLTFAATVSEINKAF